MNRSCPHRGKRPAAFPDQAVPCPPPEPPVRRYPNPQLQRTPARQWEQLQALLQKQQLLLEELQAMLQKIK